MKVEPPAEDTLVGLAIVGKNNEPLYTCDCTLRPTTPSPDDIFGFLENSGDMAQSLKIPHQFLVHAALDRLDEVYTTTQSTLGDWQLSGMPVRRQPNPAMGPHFLGELLNVADEWKVYGHVTATNIKLFALTTATGKVVPRVRAFLQEVHDLLIVHIMNPFSPTRDMGIIKSARFDQGVRAAVKHFYHPEPKTIQPEESTESL